MEDIISIPQSRATIYNENELKLALPFQFRLPTLVTFACNVCLLAVPAQSQIKVESLFERMAAQNVTGATIITHGFSPLDGGGGSLLPLAQAIQSRLAAAPGQSAWLLDYDVNDDGATGEFNGTSSILPVPGSAGLEGHAVLLFDWAAESNETSRWWADAAGDALFTLGTGLGLFEPSSGESVPIQFIGHSFGTVVTSEAVERLAGYGVPVDQVTLIDPHDFDQADVPTFDEAQAMQDLGSPDGYGATVWNNVETADVYYQTRGNQGGARRAVYRRSGRAAHCRCL